MGWPFEELISYASRGTEVRAGDVLGSGTCGNGGCLAELWGRRGRIDPPPLRPGDVVELTVEGIGTVRNRVVAGLTLPPVREARRPFRASGAESADKRQLLDPRGGDQFFERERQGCSSIFPAITCGTSRWSPR